MFLKHRSAWIAALTLLAASMLTLSLFCLRTYRADRVYPPMETIPVSTTTYPASGDSSEETAPSPLPGAQSAQTSSGWLVAFAALLLLGGAAAILLIFFCVQKKPLLGPVLALAGLCLALYMCASWQKIVLSSFWVLMPSAAVLALAALRELWGWLRAHCTPDWLFTHRLAAFLSAFAHRSGVYPLTLAWSLAVSVLVLACAYATPDGAIPVLPMAGFGLLSLLAKGVLLVRYSRAVSRLTRQIEALHAGGTVTAGKGTLARWESLLAELGTQRDEAIRTAVTSERFKVELIANVSHDLRTPLTAILGYSELLRQEPLSEVGASQLKRLCDKAGYMRELVDELFELTKVSSGASPCKTEPLDLIRLLEQTVGMYDDALTAARLEVRRHYAAAQLPLVSDGTRLHQVFSNLLGNAVKYALPGTRIHLTVSPEADGWCIRMTNVAAYDMDFDPDEIVRRFARGDKARSTQGSGLGLAIAQTYCESLGGSFRVEIHEEQFCAVVCLPNNERNL